MRNSQDTFETRKRSFIDAFLILHDCTSKSQLQKLARKRFEDVPFN